MRRLRNLFFFFFEDSTTFFGIRFTIRSFIVTDLSRNNISSIVANNFRGQDGLYELDLSFNKIQDIASWTFQHLKVSEQYEKSSQYR